MLASELGPMNMKRLKLAEVKVLKVVKDSPASVFYKYSYSEDYQETRVFKDKNCEGNIKLVPCFNERPGITSQKKSDLFALCEKNVIPKHHHLFIRTFNLSSDKDREVIVLMFKIQFFKLCSVH